MLPTGILILSMVASAAEPKVLDAAPFLDADLADCGIQRAIDSLPADGGIVQLPEGRFALERYLFLKSGTTLRGKGRKTVLSVGRPETRRSVTKDVKSGGTEVPIEGGLAGLEPGMIVYAWRFRVPSWLGYIKHYRVKEVKGSTVVLARDLDCDLLKTNRAQISWGLTTALAQPAKKGGKTIRVEHPRLFRAGYALVLSGQGDLWNHHFNVVTSIKGDTLALERPLTVSADAGAIVHHTYCMITADGQENIGVEDLTIQGWPIEQRSVFGRFYFSGIHTVRSSKITIRNVEVRHWQADGISIQAGKDCRVEDCIAVGNRGHGFHSGTNFDNGEWLRLKALRNGGDGFYYCWHDVNVNVRHCVLSENDGHGIGGLGNPGDRRCIIEHNTIERNGRAGICINGGKVSGTIIRSNAIRDNSRGKGGDWPGIAVFASAEDARAYTIEHNVVESTLAEPTQWTGIEERHGEPMRREVQRDGKKTIETRIADENVIRSNKLAGHKTADIVIVGPATICQSNGAAKVVKKPAVKSN
ncbi:MAG: right-handed parallel beta-helix repeat-containing protein [Phycisphaerae bacterium]